jgi:hypothetical protein
MIISPDEVTREARADDRTEPGLVHTRLVGGHAELLEENRLVRVLLGRCMVGDSLVTPNAAARVCALPPALRVQLHNETS